MDSHHSERGTAEVLFTHSYHLAHDPKQLERAQPYPPLGTLYAAAVARSQGFSTAVFDTMLLDPEVGFQRALEQHKPQIIVVYEDSFNYLSKMCLLRSRELSWKLCAAAAETGAVVAVHGSDSADHVDEYLDHGFDAVLLGEGEQTACELIEAVVSQQQRGGWEIPGLAWRDHGSQRVVKTAARQAQRDLSLLPTPARDLISMAAYSDVWMPARGYLSTNVVASRGCPFRCNWCAKPIYGNSYALRPAESVAAEVADLKFGHGVRHIWFADDIFALNAGWTKQFADAIEHYDAVLPFKIQSRADLMRADTVANLKRAGCNEIWMGVESGAQSVLNRMDKGLRVDAVLRARDLLRQHGIRACYFLQFGYPGEGLKEIEATIELVRATKPDDIGVSVSYPLPNTTFYERVSGQLGAKRNWVDSAELSVMFRSAYSTDFYRSLRNALHFEVEQEHLPADRRSPEQTQRHWREVYSLEPLCRTPQPTSLPIFPQAIPVFPGECEATDAVIA